MTASEILDTTSPRVVVDIGDSLHRVRRTYGKSVAAQLFEMAPFLRAIQSDPSHMAANIVSVGAM